MRSAGSKAPVVALHGFLGEPADFAATARALGQPLLAPALLGPGLLGPASDLADWPEALLAELDRASTGEPALLVGYSMGGRLAMHALARAPGRFCGAMLIGARLVAPTGAAADARRRWEQEAARRLREDPWPDFLGWWNGLGVFSGSPHPPPERPDPGPGRELLARALLNWSPRLHRVGIPELRAAGRPLRLVVGEHDSAYRSSTDEAIAAGLPATRRIIPDAGHRVPHDNPRALAAEITQFLSEITGRPSP